MYYCYGKWVLKSVLCGEVVPFYEGPLLEVPLYFCLCSDASGYSMFWHVSTMEMLSSRKEERQILGAAVGPSCETFCTVGSDGCVLVYDVNTHELIRTLEPRSVNTVEPLIKDPLR